MVEADFLLLQLSNWKNTKKIIGLAKNRYTLFKQFDEYFLCATASHLYKPSYLSLEYALSYHEIIPEGVFSFTSVSGLKTQRFNTEIGVFTYRHIKPRLFFGYQIIKIGDSNLLMAHLEKAILDFLYLNPQYQTLNDFEGLRFNKIELQEKLNHFRFENYQKIFNNQSLNKRVETLINYIYT